jgi:hypothetical protein
MKKLMKPYDTIRIEIFACRIEDPIRTSQTQTREDMFTKWDVWHSQVDETPKGA